MNKRKYPKTNKCKTDVETHGVRLDRWIHACAGMTGASAA